MHPSTRVSFFVLNDRFYKGEVAFRDFVSQSDIQLINIQDARSVRVTDSAFAEVREVDILRTDFCYADNRVVDCDDVGQLFPTSWCKEDSKRNGWTYLIPLYQCHRNAYAFIKKLILNKNER